MCLLINLFVTDEKEEGDESPKSSSSNGDNYKSKSASNVSKSPARAPESDAVDDTPDFVDIKEEDVKVPVHAQCSEPVSFVRVFLLRSALLHFLFIGTFSFR